jgi:PAS domain-containing protein
MAGNKRSSGKRVLELESLLEESREEVGYYQKIAEDSGRRRLREINQLSELISERKRAEEALRESEERLQNIINHSNEIFYIHDTKGC